MKIEVNKGVLGDVVAVRSPGGVVYLPGVDGSEVQAFRLNPEGVHPSMYTFDQVKEQKVNVMIREGETITLSW